MATAALSNLTDLHIVAAADRYGEVMRRIRELEREKDALRETLLDSGEEIIDGVRYRVVRSESKTSTLDAGAVRAMYGGKLPEMLVRESTRTTLKATERK